METHTQRNPRGQRALVGNHPLPAEHVSTTGDNIGRACAIQACVCRLWRYVLWLNGATIDRLYEVVYEKSIDNKMNDLDLCLEVVSRSRQALRYIWRWISWKPLEIEAWFHKTTNRKWPMGYQMGHVTDDVTWPQRCCEAVRWLS